MPSPDVIAKERDLRQPVLRGEEFAWRALYDDSFFGLLKYAVWRCGGRRELAEEVVQDTWLTAVRRIRDFDPEKGTFISWLRGICCHHLKNHGRANWKMSRLE